MDPKALRKRQIARRLGVSEQVLEQYLQLKNAEVLQPSSDVEGAPADDREATATSPRQRRATPRVPSWGTILRPKRG